MSKKDILNALLALSTMLGIDNDYSEIITDEQVSDCLFQAHLSMLTNDTEKSDIHYNNFEKLYNELNEEQKEVVKTDIAKILNIEYKPKIKKKER